jgi:hypothetical protein
MLGDPDEDQDVLAFGSTSTRRPMSRRVKGLIAAGGVVAVAATTCVVLALDGTHSTAQTGNLGQKGGTVTTTTIQQDSATQFQGPWSLDLSPGTVTHIPRSGSGTSVSIVTGQPTVSYDPCDKPRRSLP